MLSDQSFLLPGHIFPPPSEDTRLASYLTADNLYLGRHHLVWPDLWDVQDLQSLDDTLSTFFKKAYGQRKLEFNWFQIVCNVFSDFLVGEPPRLLGRTPVEQTHLDAIKDRSDLTNTLYRACTNLIKYNHAILKSRFIGSPSPSPGSQIDNIKPSIWFPITDPDDETKYTSHVLAWTFTAPIGNSTAKLLKVEIHEPNKIYHKLYWMNGNLIDHEVPLTTVPRFATLEPATSTGVPYPLVFTITNITEDFANMMNPVKELETRIIKVASILDIHSRPIMAGPDNALSTDMETGVESLKLNGRYFPIRDPLNRPTYIEWDGKLTSSFAEMDRVTDMLYKLVDLNPAALGDYSHMGGSVPLSGSAWKRLLIRTISKTNRIRNLFDLPVRRAIQACSILDVNGRIPGTVELTLRSVGWQDGLPRDMMEDTAVEQTRKNSGLTSKRASIMRLDDCTEEEAESEIIRMSTEIPDAPREQSPFEARLRNEGNQPRADLIPKVV